MMRMIATVLVASVGLAISPSYAGPVAPLGGPQSDVIVRVAGGCGAGFHRGPNGGCLKNFANPAAHACPRGFHVGPNGGCRGNGR